MISPYDKQLQIIQQRRESILAYMRGLCLLRGYRQHTHPYRLVEYEAKLLHWLHTQSRHF